jgi:hypothetical protein
MRRGILLQTISQNVQSSPGTVDPGLNGPCVRVSVVWKCRKWEVSKKAFRIVTRWLLISSPPQLHCNRLLHHNLDGSDPQFGPIRKYFALEIHLDISRLLPH